MTIPTLPTDNLYKFLALSGIIMLLIAVIYPATLNDKSFEKMYQLKSSRMQIEYNISEMHAKDSLINNRLTELKKSIKYDSLHIATSQVMYSLAYNDKIKELCKDKNYREYYDFIEKHKYSLFPDQAELKEIKALVKEREIIRLEINNLLISQNNKTDQLKSELELYERNDSRILFLFIFGSLFTFFGFFLWYFIVQKNLDIKIRQEAINLILENERLRLIVNKETKEKTKNSS